MTTKPEIAEKAFQKTVIDVARWNGWRVHHTRTVQIAGGGWVSPGLDRGFPDLVLCHRTNGFIVAELKRETGRVMPDQEQWIADLSASGVECYVWRPSDMPTIIERLSN